ncbi:hypothetical protein LOAG_09230 [Loa loa]|uniref:Uncharacterized protein n=1 Tax=Loa loa TaxID=7209 RepID=A0A1S0TTV2_LOALO|nr:hypothetical protein LOAG_09230 [Loa loa]EFO19261.1 hypothetical protein LOAG_09230 [Loa loa]
MHINTRNAAHLEGLECWLKEQRLNCPSIAIKYLGLHSSTYVAKSETNEKRHEREHKLPTSRNLQCSYNPFSGSNDFTENKTKTLMKKFYGLSNKIPKQINQMTKWLCLSIKHNADAILCILQIDLQTALKKINENAMLTKSKLIYDSLTGMDATTQTYPILHLFRKRELNEENAHQTDV